MHNAGTYTPDPTLRRTISEMETLLTQAGIPWNWDHHPKKKAGVQGETRSMLRIAESKFSWYVHVERGAELESKNHADAGWKKGSLTTAQAWWLLRSILAIRGLPIPAQRNEVSATQGSAAGGAPGRRYGAAEAESALPECAASADVDAELC